MEKEADQQVQLDSNTESQENGAQLTAEQVEEQKRQSALLDSINKKGQNSVRIKLASTSTQSEM